MEENSPHKAPLYLLSSEYAWLYGPFILISKVWLTNSVTLTVNVEVVKMYKNEMKSPEIYMIFAKGEFLSLFPYLGQLKNTFFTDTICYFNISHRQIN